MSDPLASGDQDQGSKLAIFKAGAKSSARWKFVLERVSATPFSKPGTCKTRMSWLPMLRMSIAVLRRWL